MKRTLLCASLFLVFAAHAEAAIHAAATTEDLAYLTKRIGGDLVRVQSLSSGDQDLHMVEPRPSMVMKLKRAKLLVRIGMDLDMWADSLIAAARNSEIEFGAPGYVDASVGMPVLQVPKGKVDGRSGDVHIYGNPHYWLDPENSRIMAKNIQNGLCGVHLQGCETFKKNRAKFIVDLDRKMAAWREQMKHLRGAKVVTYHNSWVYFMRRFGLETVGCIEPKPGIPPSPSHLNELIKEMQARDAQLIITSDYYSEAGPRKVAAKTGAKIVVVPTSAGGAPGVEDYFDLFDHITEKLAKSLERRH